MGRKEDRKGLTKSQLIQAVKRYANILGLYKMAIDKAGMSVIRNTDGTLTLDKFEAEAETTAAVTTPEEAPLA
jgi:hypothetical protein